MNRYIIIRSDTKSISSPMSKYEAVKKLRQFQSDGVSSYLIYMNKYFNGSNKPNSYKN